VSRIFENERTVFVVDPDDRTRASLRALLGTMSLASEPYASGQDFLDAYSPERPGCVVLEVKIPDVNGLDIQEVLMMQDPKPAIVFLTSHGTVSIAVRAMRAGAIHFMEKPVPEAGIWDAIRESLQIDAVRRQAWRRRLQTIDSLRRLTPKERRVLAMIGEGKSKQGIASEMRTGVRTVELRQASLRKKLGVSTHAQLLHFAICANDGRQEPAPSLAADRPCDNHSPHLHSL
jgi:FixJ family two-component response regulator